MADASPDALASLRSELNASLDAMRREILSARVQRAEDFANNLRNWLGFFAAIITIVLAGFAVLGISRYQDIQTAKQQTSADSAQVRNDRDKVAGDLAEISGYQKQVQGNATAVGTDKQKIDEALDSANKGLKLSLPQVSDMERRTTALEQKIDKIGPQVDRASAFAQTTHLDLQSAVSGVLGLNLPNITGATIHFGPSNSTITGTGFGESKGHVLVAIQSGATSAPTTFDKLTATVEFEPEITTWTKDSITLVLSQDQNNTLEQNHVVLNNLSSLGNGGYGAMPYGTGPYGGSSSLLSVRAEAADGKQSLSWFLP